MCCLALTTANCTHDKYYESHTAYCKIGCVLLVIPIHTNTDGMKGIWRDLCRYFFSCFHFAIIQQKIDNMLLLLMVIVKFYSFILLVQMMTSAEMANRVRLCAGRPILAIFHIKKAKEFYEHVHPPINSIAANKGTKGEMR